MWSVNAYSYLESHHPTLAMIESNSTYRGFFEPDPDDPHPADNEQFVHEHVAGHGALWGTSSPLSCPGSRWATHPPSPGCCTANGPPRRPAGAGGSCRCGPTGASTSPG